MTFAWPLVLLALVLVPLAALGYWWVQRRRARYAVRFTNLDLLASVVERKPGWRRHLPPALALLALAALIVGVARPHAAVKVPREGGVVVLTVDVSGSMRATDVEPDRITAARAAARSFVDSLPDSVRVGVVSFSSFVEVLTPPTDDRESVLAAIDSLEADAGTALGDAIVRSAESAHGAVGDDATDTADADDSQPAAAVLLLSDGANTQGSTEPLDAADRAEELGVPVSTVALGTADGTVEVPGQFGDLATIPVPPDEDTLREVADRTGGRYFEAPTAEQLSAVYTELGSRVGYDTVKRELTALFAGAGALLLLAGSALSALWFGRLP
jgi:Ca-activated chloride channel family protein